MPKSRVRKARKHLGGPAVSATAGSSDGRLIELVRQAQREVPLAQIVGPSSDVPSAVRPSEARAAVAPRFEPPAFAIVVQAHADHTVDWPGWPQCVAATRNSERCTLPVYPGAPGLPSASGAYRIRSDLTYGSPEAETLRRLVTQRCHLHDGADCPDAAAFEGQVSGSDKAWLAQLQQRAQADAVRALGTRQTNRDRIAATVCPTCQAVDSPKCVTQSGRPAPNLHKTRIRAALGDDSRGLVPVV